MFYEKPTLEQAEAELKRQSVRFSLAQVVAMIKDGTITAHLPPAKNGFCDWCHAYGPTRESGDPQPSSLCCECEPLGFAMMKAIYYDDAEAWLRLQQKLNARQESVGETIH